MILQTGENLVEMIPVFLCSGAGNQNVVQVGIDKGETTEDLVHKSLEGLGCITEAKGHLQELKSPKGVVMAVLEKPSGATEIWW